MRRPSTEAGPDAGASSQVLRISGLATQPGLIHGFSTLALGDMRWPGPTAGPLTAPRAAFAAALGLEPGRLVAAGAVHGAELARVYGAEGVVRGVDGLVTDARCLPLFATFADCYPIVLFDVTRPAVALAHAGWRGTLAGMAWRAVAALRREFGSSPAELIAGIGPGICGRCYHVSPEVAGRFDPSYAVAPADGRLCIDLAALNRDQLIGAGVPVEKIHVHGACTRECPELPSHRRAADGVRFACIVAIE